MEAMATAAAKAGVPVSMGFNKNVAKYTAAARAFEASHPGSERGEIHFQMDAPWIGTHGLEG
jgi:hypothetical protein